MGAGGAFMGMAGAGAGLSMMGSYNQASTQQAALGYESSVAANNAIVANYQASIAKQIGAQETQTVDLKTAQVAAQQTAQLAANGVRIEGGGTAADIVGSTKYMGARDAQTIADNTARQVWADQVSASNFAAESAADKSMAGNIRPWLSGGTSLLTGATSVANTYYTMNRAGTAF